MIGVRSKFGRGSTFAFRIILGKDKEYVDFGSQEINLEPPSNRSMATIKSMSGSNSVTVRSNENVT